MPLTPFPSQKARYFPELRGVSLKTQQEKNTLDLFKGKVTLLAVTSTQISAVSHFRFSVHGLTLAA